MVTVHTGNRPRPLLEPSLKEPSSQQVVVGSQSWLPASDFAFIHKGTRSRHPSGELVFTSAQSVSRTSAPSRLGAG